MSLLRDIYILSAMLGSLLTIIQFGLKRSKPNKKLQVPYKRWSILRGDRVKIRAGNDKGKIDRVLKVFRRSNRVLVRGVNMKTKYEVNDIGVKIKKNKGFSIHVSNVGLYDPAAKSAVRVKYAFDPETGDKLRISKKTGVILKKPKLNHLKRQKRGKKRELGNKDTPVEIAHEVTYQGEDFEAVKLEFEKFIAEKERKEKYLVFAQ